MPIINVERSTKNKKRKKDNNSKTFKIKERSFWKVEFGKKREEIIKVR